MVDIKKPKCKLVGTDGNVFAIIGNVSACLRRAGQAEKAQEFRTKAMQSASYGDVLSLCFDYVEVK